MCEIKEKFEEWKKWYDSEDEFSIFSQINLMLMDSAVFHIIIEVRKYANTDANGNQQLNVLVHDLIDRTFLGTQTLSIRRLCEKYDEGRDRRGEREIISLRRLIDDMKNNSALLTRENILSALGFPYDYKKTMEEGLETNNDSLIDKGMYSESVHKNIDLLARVDPAQRQPNDTVKDSVFDELNERLGKCTPIVNFVNKTVAHSATKQSKGKVPAKDLTTSLAQIHKSHCRIVKVTAFIGQFILYESSGWANFLPYYMSDEFEHFEKPWIKQDDIIKLKDSWSRYEKHIDKLNKKPERIIKNNP